MQNRPLQSGIEPEQLTRWSALLAGFLFAFYLAYLIGTAQTSRVMMLIIVISTISIMVGFQRKAWILILLGWSVTGITSILPLPFSGRDLCILLATGAYLCYRIVSQQSLHYRWRALDIVVALNLAWVGICFARNPVGLRAFGAETIGGRPVFNIFMAAVAYWVIVRLPDSVRTVSRAPYYIVAGTAIVALLNIVVYIAPSATPYLFPFYGGVDLSSYFNTGSSTGQLVTRFVGLRDFGITLVLVLCAAYPPRTLLNPLRLRFYFFLFGFGAVLAAGFRTSCLGVIAALVISSWLHEGWRGVVIVTAAGSLLLGTLVLGQGRIYQLPLPVQRALTFLPGKWAPEMVEETEQSSEGRFEWWRKVIENHVIENWWMGDGFGLSSKDYYSAEGTASAKGGAALFDFFTLTGTFHNGPLSAIRFVGCTGLALLYALFIGGAVYSLKYVGICRGTPLHFPAMFVTLQFLWIPVEYAVLYGAYDVQLPDYVFLAALLALIIRMSARARPVVTAPAPTPSPQAAIASSFG